MFINNKTQPNGSVSVRERQTETELNRGIDEGLAGRESKTIQHSPVVAVDRRASPMNRETLVTWPPEALHPVEWQ